MKYAHTDPQRALPRFVELVRVSGRAQKERDTPEVQRRALDKFRDHRPGIFVERIEHTTNLSGALAFDKRPDLQRLAHLADEKAFDEIRVYHIDRLTRAEDPRDRFAVYGIALDAGAIFIDTNGKEIDPKSEYGELQWQFDTKSTSNDRKKILRQTHGGRMRVASEGKKPSGPTPFGFEYIAKTGEWKIHPGRSEVVLDVFRRSSEGHSVNAIVAHLNDSNALSPRGKGWARTSVSRILTNPVYNGTYRCVFSAVGEEPQPFEIALPKFVPDELWHKAGFHLKERRTRPPRSGPASIDALARGLAECGECGSPVHVWTQGSRSGGRVYYRCKSVQYGSAVRSCTNRYHQITKIDPIVWSIVQKLVNHPELLTEAIKSPRTSEASWEEQIASAEKKLAALKRDELATVRLVSSGLSQEVLQERIKEIARQRVICVNTIEAAQRHVAARAVGDAEASALNDRLQGLVGTLDCADFPSRVELLAAVLAEGGAVLLHRNGVSLRTSYRGVPVELRA